MIYFIYSRQTGQNYYPPWNRGPSHWLSRNYLVANCMWSSGSPVERSVPCTRPKPNTFPSTEIPSTLHGDLWPLNIFPIRRKKTSKLFQFQFQFYLNRFVSHRLTTNIYFIFPFISITQWIRSGFYQEVRLLAALDDPHLSRVLAVCTTEEPFCVVLEYLDYGDLNQFLKLHRFRPDHQVNSSDSRNNISRTFSTQDETLTYE